MRRADTGVVEGVGASPHDPFDPDAALQKPAAAAAGSPGAAAKSTRPPLFADAVQRHCYDDVVEAGDVIHYPPRWWHATLNLGDEVVGLAARMFNEVDYNGTLEELELTCGYTKGRSRTEAWELFKTRDKVW